MVMPANDITAWIRDLRARLRGSHQRRILALQGEREWCDKWVAGLTSLTPSTLVFSDRPLPVESMALGKARVCLGQEADLVLLDGFTGLDPDALCIVSGLVRAGGILVLCLPTLDQWQSADDRYAVWQGASYSSRPRFSEYFLATLAADAQAGHVLHADDSLPDLVDQAPLAITEIESGATRGQAGCLARIDQWLAKNERGVVLIRAPRGRGKSTCLGMLVEQQRERRSLLVCAPSRASAATLLERVPDAGFVAPDELLREQPNADLVVIDEAAMIPLALLEQIRQRYPRLVLAATSGGYEGTGQGFLLRFIDLLESDGLLELTLDQPVRWCEEDYLERWLDRVLLMQPTLDRPELPIDAGRCALEVIDHPATEASWEDLSAVYRLLCDAHYRTRPSDLRMLLENPDLSLIVARVDRSIVGAALLNPEGGLDATLCSEIFYGRRRPRGHLLAQMLTAQAGLADFATRCGLRIQRLAVHPDWRRLGIGRQLIEACLVLARERQLDYVGASFALEAAVAAFWQGAGFSLVHVSYARGKSSGSHSIAVLQPLSAAVEKDCASLRERLQRQLPVWMGQYLQWMEFGQVVALLRYAAFRAELTTLEQQELDAFARGHRGFELCFASLQRFAMQWVGQTRGEVDRLLIAKAVQNRSWASLAQSGSEGRQQLQTRLRELVEAALKAC